MGGGQVLGGVENPENAVMATPGAKNLNDSRAVRESFEIEGVCGL
jgi:hypothetical protein